MDEKSEFYKAAYWKFEGSHVRLTAYNERDLPSQEMAELAFQRARHMNLQPLYLRVYFGEFLRHGFDAFYAPCEVPHV